MFISEGGDGERIKEREGKTGKEIEGGEGRGGEGRGGEGRGGEGRGGEGRGGEGRGGEGRGGDVDYPPYVKSCSPPFGLISIRPWIWCHFCHAGPVSSLHH